VDAFLLIFGVFMAQTLTSAGTHRTGRNALDWIAGALVVIGGINWGLVGLLHFDLVAAIFGPMSLGARVVYVLVGLAAIVLLVRAFVPTANRNQVVR
jgi:uncharacterized membrane protein YuzA (DUF378 family)